MLRSLYKATVDTSTPYVVRHRLPTIRPSDVWLRCLLVFDSMATVMSPHVGLAMAQTMTL